MTKEKCCKQNNKILNKGFTLIELLVVVLIIGILAAIAVTQYKKSVLKSKYSTLLPLTKALHDSQEMFDLTRGYYTDNFSDLELPDNATVNDETATLNNDTFTIGNTKKHIYIKATKTGINNNYVMYQSKSKYFPNEIHCEAKTDNYLANWLCKDELGGTKLDRSLTEGYTDYVITGNGNGLFPTDYVNVYGITLTEGDTCTGNEGTYQCRELSFYDGECYGQAYAACARSSYVNSYCEGTSDIACSESTFNNSTCIGPGYGTCRGSFINSTCTGGGAHSCSGTFNDSVCIGNRGAVCNRSLFEGNSTCIGNSADACSGSKFKGNSICYANVEGACEHVYDPREPAPIEITYEDHACCSGQYCPDYAPKCDCNIDENTGQHATSC